MSSYLNPERATQLAADLRQLHRARQRAWVEYPTAPAETRQNQ